MSRTGVSDVAEHRPEREGERTTPSAAGDRSTDAAEKPAKPADRPPGGLTVEQITHQDVPAVCALYKKVWESERVTDLPVPLVKSWQPTPLEFTSWMEGVTYFAGRRDGRLIGAVGCELREGSCRLVHLAVDPEFRRQGVASALLGSAVEWAKRSNVPEVWVDALARFTAAASLFRHLGFAECGHLHRHQWNEDVLFFERLLE